MNRYKQPKTAWKTDAWEDKQIIQKAVKWSQTEGIVLLVGKPKDEIFPETFIYMFAPNMADITKPVEIILTKNRQYIFGWKCELEDMDEIIGTMTANAAHGRKGEFVRLPRESRYNPIPIHYTRRTERSSEIPVSWILRKLSDAICKVAAGTVR